ncbi:bifunctional lysylphosphatidylglycerol flippase/synthetase MprF [Amorphus orientalis]|uniref:Phosphatidylglycerol lysyltransferase n=1 Tax=Amorphus orientalis TaxID=649198 RepID=A0AAE3VPY9_9HYPH|nr:bifunctional lysylphosphatidylglycerol flippase/synthetase MprF [Amorphus orientalis]MDQ0316088.1 phosphatidylglycerol lysyltransferase [Amorphus orientalis]
MDTAGVADDTEIARIGRSRWRWRRFVGPVLSVALLVLVAVAIEDLARDVRYDDVAKALAETPSVRVLIAVLLTFVSFGALTLYDVSGLEYAGQKIRYRLVAPASFCAYAIGNTAGFGPLSGGAVRYRLYTPLGLKPDQIARLIGFITVGFGLGLCMTASIGLLVAGDAVADVVRTSPALLQAAGAGLAALALLPVVWTLLGNRTIRLARLRLPLPSAGLLARQLLITAIDVTACAGVLWVLLPQGSIGFPAFVAIFAVAIGVAVLSHVPAGLGVFDAIIVAALAGVVPVDQVLGAIVIYRLVYYALPLAVAALIIVTLEVRRALAGSAATRLAAVARALAPPVLTTLSLVTGAMLVLSGLTPAPPRRLEALAAYVPLPIVESAHFLSSILGTVFVVTARFLLFRLDGAWWVTAIAAALALALAPLKALAVGETMVLALLLVSLLLSRSEFDRPSSLLHETLSRRWIVAIATVAIATTAVMFFAYKEVAYSSELWWQFAFSDNAPRSLRALLGILLASSLFAIWWLLMPAPGVPSSPSPEDMDRALTIAVKQDRPEANLVRTGDKSILFSDDGEAFIMFARQGRSWVALFDPIGATASWPGLVWKFNELARRHGGRAVFYEVGPDHLALYADAGLAAFRLGESARVGLEAFDLQGSRRAELRTALRKGDKLGLSFELVPPERVGEIIDELAQVSDAWLTHNKVREKGFSLGSFQRDYVATQPIATLRQDGKVIAFASLMTTDSRHEVALDLMRVAPGAPNGTMDFLFLKLILLLKDEGYAWFRLGMAPLAGFRSGSATLWNRVGRAVFEHGERYYHFRGLHKFKNKFSPEWQPRYMAVAGGLNPLVALADVAVLISGGLRGVVSK